MNKAFVKDFVIYGVSSSLTKVFGILLVPLYTRIFSSKDYGSMDLISTVVNLAALLGMLQLESAVSRYYYEENDEKQKKNMLSTSLFVLILFSMLFLVILLLMVGKISLFLFHSDFYVSTLIIASLTIPMSNINNYLAVIMRFKKEPFMYLIFQFLLMFITTIVSVILIFFYRYGIIAIFYGQVCGYLVVDVIMGYYLRFDFALKFDLAILKKMMRYSLPTMPSTFFSYANSYFNRFIMLGYLSVAEIGVYVVALKIASIFSLIGNAFRMAWGPFFWETLEMRSNHRNIFRDILENTTYIISCAVIVITLFSRNIIEVFATQQYIFASKIVGILALSLAINNVIIQIISMGPSIVKKTEYITLFYFASTAINIGALFIFVPKLGLVGVPLSLLTGDFFLLILSWLNSETLYYIGFRAKPVIISMLAILIILLLNYYMEITNILKVSISLIIFYFIYNRYFVLLKRMLLRRIA